jgi:hypothetical protein
MKVREAEVHPLAARSLHVYVGNVLGSQLEKIPFRLTMLLFLIGREVVFQKMTSGWNLIPTDSRDRFARGSQLSRRRSPLID